MNIRAGWLIAACFGAAACSDTVPQEEPDMASEGDAGTDAGAMDSAMDDAGASDGPTTYLAEVWADNWSAMYVGDVLVMEDSVPITTERSFNAEVFTFDATPPFQLNVVLKDYIENDSGLEYIGERNQQMGDGGYIAQLTDMSSGEVALVSNADWRCLTIHEAPLNTDCEGDANPLETCLSEISDEPEGWYAADFDDSAWVAASVYSEAEVSPRLGYDEITWNTDAELIWGADLQTHNTVLCRVTVR